uniref:Uncharacterized protein n=1 Tax=Romanomermis culicivorax TaxID=13658 RepID=A0A915KCE6_ROMCU
MFIVYFRTDRIKITGRKTTRKSAMETSATFFVGNDLIFDVQRFCQVSEIGFIGLGPAILCLIVSAGVGPHSIRIASPDTG